MTQEQRNRLHETLMGGVDPKECPELDEMTAAEVDKLAPLIDGWLKAAEGESDNEEKCGRKKEQTVSTCQSSCA